MTTPAQERILEVLYDFRGERCGAVDLSEYIGTKEPTIREHIQKMLKSGVVEFTPGRQRSLRITKKGIRALKRSQK